MKLVNAEQDGFTVCINDTEGNAHCFRIDKKIGAELCARVNAFPDLVAALRQIADENAALGTQTATRTVMLARAALAKGQS